jgi:diacylglycerol kinase family enzyme
MEPLVTIENTRIRRVSGNLRYVLALGRALWRLRAWRMRVTWDDGEFEGPVFLLSVCNGPRCGGLFPMAPQARFDDGLLDFVLAPETPKTRVPGLLLRLFRGRHAQHPGVISGRTRRLSLLSEPGTPIHADGEVIAEAATRVDYEVLPGKITLLCPAGEGPKLQSS